MKTIEWTFHDEDGINPTKMPVILDFLLSYTYSPGEKMVRYYSDGSGYPGSPPEIEIYKAEEIHKIPIFGDWFLEHINNDKILREEIENAICEQMEQRYHE